jgi:3-phenylpropionate/trans-cinnamate dioxygenase ferredoxin subunit
VIDLCAFEELGDGAARRFDVGSVRVAVVRIGDEVFAVGDRCTHADISLSEGEVDAAECTLECWKHGSLFDLRTGEALSLPATRPTPVYEAKVVDGRVMVAVEL